MSQKAALRAIDAAIHAAASSAGFADTGVYTPAGGGPAVVGVRIYRDDAALTVYGEARPAAAQRVELQILRADVDEPLRGSTIVVDGDSFVLEELIEVDQSMSRWVVADA